MELWKFFQVYIKKLIFLIFEKFKIIKYKLEVIIEFNMYIHIKKLFEISHCLLMNYLRSKQIYDRNLRYLDPAVSPTGNTEIPNTAAILINPLFSSDCASWWGKLIKKVAKNSGIIILAWLPSQDWEDENVQGKA